MTGSSGPVDLRLITEVLMLTKLLLSVVALVSPGYAHMCGESDGIVRCTDDVERDSMLQALDRALKSPSGVTALSGYPLLNHEMATYPRDVKSDDLLPKPRQSTSDKSRIRREQRSIAGGLGLGLDSRMRIKDTEEMLA
jgi:hypothetical protein